MKITVCVGTRPNLIKAAPLLREMDKYDIYYRFVHTGQHYDNAMDRDLMADLGLPKPDFNIECGVYSEEIKQMAHVIHYFANDCEDYKPDLIIVLGDVTSTLACALVANKMGIKLAHIEAGERSGNKSMPEEMNRILVDQMSDFLFCASSGAATNLNSERLDCILVGNLMVDQLLYIKSQLNNYAVMNEPYAVLTLHRQENVDDPEKLKLLFNKIIPIAEKIRVVFPCHPRTKERIKQFDTITQVCLTNSNIDIIDPEKYSDFIALVSHAKFVMTDSGGLQVETSILDVPCLTLRNETEWRETLVDGTNVLINDYDLKSDAFNNLINAHVNDKYIGPKGRRWFTGRLIKTMEYDGKASLRIMEHLAFQFEFKRKK